MTLENTDPVGAAAASIDAGPAAQPIGSTSAGSTPAVSDPGQPAPTLWQQMGGPVGMLDSGLPVLVFVVVNAIVGLRWGILAAVLAGLVIAGLRLARRKPVTQAVGGLFAVGVAAFIAYRTGSAKGYFLLGIWLYVVYGGALLLSILVRWPLIGALWEGLNGRGTGWRRDRALVRRYDWATGVWVAVFALRFVVQGQLYRGDHVGWLATARVLMGYPLYIAGIVVTVLIVGPASGMRLPWSKADRLDRTEAADAPVPAPTDGPARS